RGCSAAPARPPAWTHCRCRPSRPSPSKPSLATATACCCASPPRPAITSTATAPRWRWKAPAACVPGCRAGRRARRTAMSTSAMWWCISTRPKSPCRCCASTPNRSRRPWWRPSRLPDRRHLLPAD
ncbi:hypothetical protein XPN_4685, partial [Xanthomonas arboricola pv. pruni MAFF 301427]